MLVTLPVSVLSASVAGLSGAAETSQGPHRVVMHLNSGDEKVQRGALNNIRNLYQEVGRKHVLIELVVHGAGLTLLTKKCSTLAPIEAAAVMIDLLHQIDQLRARLRQAGLDVD